MLMDQYLLTSELLATGRSSDSSDRGKYYVEDPHVLYLIWASFLPRVDQSGSTRPIVIPPTSVRSGGIPVFRNMVEQMYYVE